MKNHKNPVNAGKSHCTAANPAHGSWAMMLLLPGELKGWAGALLSG